MLVVAVVVGGLGRGGGALGVMEREEVLQLPQPPLVQHSVVEARVQRPRQLVAGVLGPPERASVGSALRRAWAHPHSLANLARGFFES